MVQAMRLNRALLMQRPWVQTGIENIRAMRIELMARRINGKRAPSQKDMVGYILMKGNAKA